MARAVEEGGREIFVDAWRIFVVWESRVDVGKGRGMCWGGWEAKFESERKRFD